MGYGQTDDIIEAREECEKAVGLLIEVAVGKKSVNDVRAWLEQNYPKLCVTTVTTKKW